MMFRIHERSYAAQCAVGNQYAHASELGLGELPTEDGCKNLLQACDDTPYDMRKGVIRATIGVGARRGCLGMGERAARALLNARLAEYESTSSQ